VRTLLDSFVEMGVDLTDPVEPPPQGDVDFTKAKETYGDKLVLLGNIEFLAMETAQPDDVEELVRQAIEDGGKQSTILYTSAGPHQRPSDQMLANAVRYVEAGLKYGKM
jgi:uroporphyrinogen-III decarboxylase